MEKLKSYKTNFKKRNLFWRSSINPCYNCPDSQRWFCNLHPEVRAECATLSGKDIKGDSRVILLIPRSEVKKLTVGKVPPHVMAETVIPRIDEHKLLDEAHEGCPGCHKPVQECTCKYPVKEEATT